MNAVPITIGRCAQVYQETIEQYGSPEILNTDQGSQFTSTVFTKISVDNKIKTLWMEKKSFRQYLYRAILKGIKV